MASEEQPQAESPAAETPVAAKEEPETRRVVMLTGTGGLNKVVVQKVAKRKPGEGQVLVKVHAR